MTDTRAGAIIMLAGKPHVIITGLSGKTVLVAPIKRRRTSTHRADVQISLPGYGKAHAACGTATTHSTDALPVPIAYLGESVTLVLQVAMRREAQAQAAERRYDETTSMRQKQSGNPYALPIERQDIYCVR
jgi:hypothetical protein